MIDFIRSFKKRSKKDFEKVKDKVKDEIVVSIPKVTQKEDGTISYTYPNIKQVLTKEMFKERYESVKAYQLEVEEFDKNKSRLLQEALWQEIEARDNFDENNIESVVKLESAQKGVIVFIEQYRSSKQNLLENEAYLRALEEVAIDYNIELN